MPKASYALRPLVVQEVAAMDGFTHLAQITANDLTTLAANTAQTFDLGPIALGAAVQVEIRLTVPFQDISDAAFNSTSVVIGDTTTANSLLTTQQLNLNGTEIVVPVRGTLSSVYATDETLRVTISAMAAKALNDIDKGQLDILVKIQNPNPLLNVKGTTGITK